MTLAYSVLKATNEIARGKTNRIESLLFKERLGEPHIDITTKRTLSNMMFWDTRDLTYFVCIRPVTMVIGGVI